MKQSWQSLVVALPTHLQQPAIRGRVRSDLIRTLRNLRIDGEMAYVTTEDIIAIIEGMGNPLIAAGLILNRIKRDFGGGEAAEKIFSGLISRLRRERAHLIAKRVWSLSRNVVSVSQSAKCVDFGAHDGLVTEAMACGTMPFTGYDIAPAASTVVECDEENIPLPNGTADFVTAICSLHHTADPAKSLREIVRITKNGGKVAILESVIDTPTISTGIGVLSVADFISNWVLLDNQVPITGKYLDHVGWLMLCQGAGLKPVNTLLLNGEANPVDLGHDEPLIAARHTLFLFEK